MKGTDDFDAFCEANSVCEEAVAWADEAHVHTLKEAWDRCPRADWMFWALEGEDISNSKGLRELGLWCADQLREHWDEDGAMMYAAALGIAEGGPKTVAKPPKPAKLAHPDPAHLDEGGLPWSGGFDSWFPFHVRGVLRALLHYNDIDAGWMAVLNYGAAMADLERTSTHAAWTTARNAAFLRAADQLRVLYNPFGRRHVAK